MNIFICEKCGELGTDYQLPKNGQNGVEVDTHYYCADCASEAHFCPCCKGYFYGLCPYEGGINEWGLCGECYAEQKAEMESSDDDYD